MRSLLLACALLLVSGCGNFDRGDNVQAWVQRDPYNPCRVIVKTEVPTKTFSAIIEGCKG